MIVSLFMFILTSSSEACFPSTPKKIISTLAGCAKLIFVFTAGKPVKYSGSRNN